MNKHVGKRPLTFWVAMALFVSGFGLLGFGAWQHFSRMTLMVPLSKVRHLASRLVAPRLEPDYVRLIGEGTLWQPVPKALIGSKEGGRYMTMTSCDPIYVNTNRIIVWFELERADLAGQKAPSAVTWLEPK